MYHSSIFSFCSIPSVNQEPPLPLPGFTSHTTSVRHICHWCCDHQTLRPQLLGTAASTAILCILCILHMLRAGTPALPGPCRSWSPQITHSSKLCGKGREPLSILMLNSFGFKQLTERKSPVNGGFKQKKPLPNSHDKQSGSREFQVWCSRSTTPSNI